MPVDGNMRPIVKKNIALCIVFSIITCGIYSWFWLGFLGYLMEVFDISPSNVISILGFASLLIPYFLLKKLRKNAFAKLDKKYIDQVNALRYSDPAKFNEIVMELNRRQGR